MSVDGAYSNRNNNSDHGVVTIVEQSTPFNFLLHLAMKYASSDCILQQLELKLIKEGLKCIIEECEFQIKAVVHDGKEIAQSALDEICGEDTLQAGDPWHGQKLIQKGFQDTVTEQTRCIMGNKKEEIPADTKEVKQQKMKLWAASVSNLVNCVN